MSTKYFLKVDWQESWSEVTERQFITAERAAGFRPKGGGDGLATGGFSGGGVSGGIEIIQDKEGGGEGLEQKTEIGPGQPPGMGDKSFCTACGKPIEYVGGPYWRHTTSNPRHLSKADASDRCGWN